MFSGNWRESNLDRVAIDVADPNVDRASFHVALGSLYQDEVTLAPGDVVPVLAAATLLQLDGLIEQCVGLMKETVNVKTVLKYLEASQIYGQSGLEKVRWMVLICKRNSCAISFVCDNNYLNQF
jgi:BTB/POZ domain-containing protein 13